MDFWLLYLMTRTEDIGYALGPIAIMGAMISLFAAFISLVMADEMGETMTNRVRKITRRALVIASVCGVLSVLMPTRNDWYVMIGGYYVTHIEGVDKLPVNVVGAANEFLKRYQEEEEQGAKKQGGGA
jgi:hypothetical protein